MKVMVIVKASKDSEADKLPSQQLLSDMQKFNEELAKAGIIKAAEGWPVRWARGFGSKGQRGR